MSFRLPRRLLRFGAADLLGIRWITRLDRKFLRQRAYPRIGCKVLRVPNLAWRLLQISQWTWTDGSSFEFQNWAKDEPANAYRNRCLSMDAKNGRWSSQNCSNSAPFACEFPAWRMLPPCPFPEPTTTPNPIVVGMDQIRRQLLPDLGRSGKVLLQPGFGACFDPQRSGMRLRRFARRNPQIPEHVDRRLLRIRTPPLSGLTRAAGTSLAGSDRRTTDRTTACDWSCIRAARGTDSGRPSATSRWQPSATRASRINDSTDPKIVFETRIH
ncbi:hypothetical protein L596_015288 [Steinernema carpocapsae]|uniref:C-type lectin domain-containing protein n=1 Tax=Steinernema carpocapsae TaxID=34508 RepID=A0A4U5NEJ9_STECR|nr:hypothetical protein L596_015288 [Steinernema carpocapsae]